MLARKRRETIKSRAFPLRVPHQERRGELNRERPNGQAKAQTMPTTIAARNPNDTSAASTFSRIESSIVASCRLSRLLITAASGLGAEGV